MTTDITLSLTEEEWSELANAVQSKIILIDRGDYGVGEEHGGNERWAATLTRVLDHVAEKLEEKGLAW